MKIKLLKNINITLWDIVNIRVKESNNEFDNEFTELARNVYLNNDKRLKLRII